MFRQYYSAEAPEVLLERPSVLSVISFDSQCEASQSPGYIPTGLESLSEHVSEVFECTNSTVTRGVYGRCHWSRTDDIMFAAIWISNEDCTDIELATETAYTDLLQCLITSGFSNPFRFWNFIPNINAGPGDREEYKKFCVGRLSAFENANVDTSAFPAASALGHHAKGAVIYALASKNIGVHYENPLQESAYRYPREYGPSSPSFARASKITIENESWVFISGTASILGHQTHCPGDISEQLRITLGNIEHLTQHIVGESRDLSTIRVYLRHRDHYTICRSYLTEHLPHCDITYTLADICRVNLLVEIEASFSIGATSKTAAGTKS